MFCPVCDGASADYRLPPCKECLNIGHVYLDREHDGTPPTHHKCGTPVRLWIDRELGPVPNNPLRLTNGS